MKIHVGVFARDGQNGIASALADLARQDLFRRAMALATIGSFDLLVYVNAQLQMVRGRGAGYWQ